MREFSFGKSTPPEEEADGDSGSSPSLNIFYAKPNFNKQRIELPLNCIKEETITQPLQMKSDE